jgi:putative transposase
MRIFGPETVLKWHRELVRRKWTFKKQQQGGRPRTNPEVEVLIVRFARENSDRGYGKIRGELLKLGYELSEQTIGTILARHGIPPAPQRGSSVSWRHLMQHYKSQLLACDFFTIETLFLKTLYVLFFIELGTRRVHIAGCTVHPNGEWITQQARQLVWSLDEHSPPIRLLIHDNDGKFPSAFDTVFQAEGITIIHTPVRAPNANAYAERWVRSIRHECLDKLIILDEAHLWRVLRDYTAYYNTRRPHQGLQQQSPIPRTASDQTGRVYCRDVLGGIIHDYYRAA